MELGNKYFSTIQELLREIENTQEKAIEQAAQIIMKVYKKDGIIHLFGSGHSFIPAVEVFIRAGSLTFANALWPRKNLDTFERVEGIGKALISKYDLRKGEAIFVFSNSGINPLPIEVAQEAKNLGLKVIAVTSLEHSKKMSPRNSAGKKLFEIADLTIDSCVPYGDAALELDDFSEKVGPVSTISTVSIINAVFTEAAHKINQAGLDIPIRVSRNTPEGDSHNKKFIDKYGTRIPELRY